MELFYKFSPILMQKVPRSTVDAWMKQAGALKPKRLIPALVQCHHKDGKVQVRKNDLIIFMHIVPRKYLYIWIYSEVNTSKFLENLEKIFLQYH